MTNKLLQIKNIRENNLKNIDLSLDHDKLIAITGLSGSGKSTLAFDTVYAEGQRRYIETFSSYTRQFLDKIKKPEIDACSGVRPALAIQQKTKIHSSRSSVGSLTDINEYIAILFANFSKPYSPVSGKKLLKFTAHELSQLLIKNKSDFQGTIYITAPVELSKKLKETQKQIESLETLGYSRFFIEGSSEIYKFAEDKKKLKNGLKILILLDRLKTDKLKSERLRDAISQAYQISRGKCIIATPENQTFIYTQHYSDSETEVMIPKTGHFLNSSPLGACPDCRGFGRILSPDATKIILNPALSIAQDAADCWKGESSKNLKRQLLTFCEANDLETNISWNQLEKEKQDLIFEKKILPWFKKIEKKSYKPHVRIFLAKYRSQFDCETCNTTGLKSDALIFKLADKNISEIQNLEINELIEWLQAVEKTITKNKSQELNYIIAAVKARLEYLENLGLSYLTLNRSTKTLSGGETQRVNLAAALGSDLVSTQFVLDEPSVGLHPRDTERLLKSIRNLQAKGNSVLMVEHDPDCILSADEIIHLGPKAGHAGGEIVYQGSANKWQGKFETTQVKDRYLKTSEFISIKNAKVRNLKNIALDLPLNQIVAISGVSGSGKSTLAEEIIIPAWQYLKNPALLPPPAKVEGLEQLSNVLMVDQSGLAKSPRANIATYSGIWDRVRILLSKTPLAENRMLTKSAFSFNVDAGRCTECKGTGYLKEEMQFLSDVYIPCEICLGKRFQESVLDITYKDKSAWDWLQTTVLECRDLLKEEIDIYAACEYLIKLGLGHLRLGHSLSELSGGEAQRLKLVPFIQKSKSGHCLLIFDEPTTGLHIQDVHQLLDIFEELRAKGHSIVCIEHNQEVLLAADYIIDLGPEGGKAGGEIVFSGTPKDLLKEKSHTALHLDKYIKKFTKNKFSAPLKNTFKKYDKNKLIIHNAREHNLKNISVEIPHNQMVAITGVSGSGKSTIAKDIIYAEGQRRYLDCLSPYARQFIKELSKPDIGKIENLCPTICVYQHTFQPGKLSTVGTLSEVYNYLRLLYAKAGTQYCPEHPTQPVTAITAENMLEKIKSFGTESIKILAPVIKEKKGHHRSIFQKAQELEIDEVRVDGKFYKISQVLEGLERNKLHSIDFVWSQIVPERITAELILMAINEVIALSTGTLIVHHNKKDLVLSNIRGCPICNTGVFKPDPEDFSFNSRRGRCTKCEGSGCKTCNYTRLKPTGLSVKLEDKNIAELSNLNIKDLEKFIKSFKLPAGKQSLATPIITEILARTERLSRFGLTYLPLSRSARALSKGELQRLRLATAIGSPLSGVLYIFDEPSAGLHPKDNQAVLNELKTIKDNNNSVIIIEHDEESIMSSDHIIEVGPGGGKDGGEITYNGNKNNYKMPPIPEIKKSYQAKQEKFLHITAKEYNNIKNLNTKIPLQNLVTVSGVSGAGKSSLVNGIILQSLLDEKNSPGTVQSDLTIDRILVVDQKPIGKNSRSTPASYLKIWDEVRKLLAQTPIAKARGWDAGFFSYNSAKGGRCPECNGMGRQKLEMSFLSEAYIQCEYCNGNRFSDEALAVTYLNLNISEILNLTFSEAKKIFTNYPKIYGKLKSACDLGLGYLTLGQSSATLSGGESQRIKLTEELSIKPRGHTLYLLEEPTVGLHQKDVALLLNVLQSLVARGDSVIVIEHDELFIKNSDYIVEMGPGAGNRGGKVIPN